MTSELETAILAARQAGQILRHRFGGQFKVDYKGAIDPVTEMDHQAQTLIANILGDPYPSYRLIAEEGLKHYSPGQTHWIVDPLDGTTNYSRGYPFFAVSIALEKDGEILLGVVYNPILDELFVAERGKGALLNGQPIRVSQTVDLGKAVLASGFPYDMWTNPIDNASQWARFIKRTFSLRCDGAASLDFCHVAMGRLDGYWELDLEVWDMAAGALIVQEAGGRVSGVDGSPFSLDHRRVLASNGYLHNDLLSVIDIG